MERQGSLNQKSKEKIKVKKPKQYKVIMCSNVLNVQRNIGASVESRKEYEEVLIIGE